jgi:hypothetical protein
MKMEGIKLEKITGNTVMLFGVFKEHEFETEVCKPLFSAENTISENIINFWNNHIGKTYTEICEIFNNKRL